MEEPVATDVTRDVPEQKAEDRADAGDGTAMGNLEVIRHKPSRPLPVDAHGEGGCAAGEDEDERQRERAPHEERHGKCREDDRQ